MPEISDPQVTRLEAFDRNGLHLGYAQQLLSGRWCVSFILAIDEAQARRILESFGATQFVTDEGKK